MGKLPKDTRGLIFDWVTAVRDLNNADGVFGLLKDDPAELWAVASFGPTHTRVTRGIVKEGTLVAAVLIGERGLELRVGTSTPERRFEWQAVWNLRDQRHKPGEPGDGHLAPEFASPRRRRAGIAALVVLQMCAALQEASQSGHIPELTQRLGLRPGEIAVAALFTVIGQMIGMRVAKRRLAKGVGTRQQALVAAVLYVGLTLASLARGPHFVGLAIVALGWLLFGLGNAPADVAITVIGDRLNEGDERGQWLATGMAVFTWIAIGASAITIPIVAVGISMTAHLGAVWLLSLVLTAAVVLLVPNLHQRPVAGEVLPPRRAVRLSRRTLRRINLIGAASLMPLGAVLTYSALVLTGLGASKATASQAPFWFLFAGGVVQTVISRMRTLRPRRIVIASAIAAFIGAIAIALAAFDTHLPHLTRIAVALGGFLIVGAGLQLTSAVMPSIARRLALRFKVSSEMAQANLLNANYTGLFAGQAAQGAIAAVAGIPLAASILFAISGVAILTGAPEVPEEG